MGNRVTGLWIKWVQDGQWEKLAANIHPHARSWEGVIYDSFLNNGNWGHKVYLRQQNKLISNQGTSATSSSNPPSDHIITYLRTPSSPPNWTNIPRFSFQRQSQAHKRADSTKFLKRPNKSLGFTRLNISPHAFSLFEQDTLKQLQDLQFKCRIWYLMKSTERYHLTTPFLFHLLSMLSSFQDKKSSRLLPSELGGVVCIILRIWLELQRKEWSFNVKFRVMEVVYHIILFKSDQTVGSVPVVRCTNSGTWTLFLWFVMFFLCNGKYCSAYCSL